LFIAVTKGSLSAGLSEKVHIYAGLESKGEFTFTNADFTATVYLAGTVSLPGTLTWADMSSGTVNVYSDAARTDQIGTVSLTELSWVAGISVTYIGSTVYLGAALTGTNGKIYTGTGGTGGSVTETGVRTITLADTTSPADISGLTGASGPGDGQVTLTWTDPVDADLDHVEITWAPGGTSPVSVLKGTQTQTISGLTNGTSYTFTVKAVDTAGNESGDETATATPFVPVTDITGLPATGTVGDITLSGTVEPSSATYKTIVWSVKEAETTAAGAEINNGVLSTTGAGSVKVIATITDGTAVGTPYIKEFSITIIINPPSSGDQMTGTISGVSVSFRYVPAGSFQRDNTAANVTTITKGYWMGETEVTQELFLKVMGVNPSEFNGSIGKEPDSGETQTQRPVENVSWYDAIAFCNKLSLLDGRNPVYSVTVSGSEVDWAALAYNDIPSDINVDWNAVTMDTGKNGYRLPTEMEWMWAAIGADTAAPGQLNITGYDKAFAGSDGFNNVDDYAWYDDNSNSKTHEVGKKAANELGLKDMSGNVVEWCWDRYGDYPDEIQTDPQGASSGTNRVIRGGGRYSVAADVRSATRYDYTPSNRYANVGFRLVRPQF
jgi:formylglycine-generating enzyme required for sulfatase activity